MRITRREHATQIVELDGGKLVIDPGSFTTFASIPVGVEAVVITHEHADHWSPDLVNELLKVNPEARCFGTPKVADSAGGVNVDVVTPGESVEAANFELRFFGGTHARIHCSIPLIDNVGVLVNNTLFYGGDSLEPPGVPVDVLAVPASGPWLKMGEMMDYVLAVVPNRTFTVHDMLNSGFGNAMANARTRWAAEQGAGSHVDLEPGDSLEV